MRKLQTFIGPSILSADFANLQADCEHVLSCGANSLHIDIMDGHFVNNLTIGAPVVSSLRKKLADVHFDCHLMVTNPQMYLQPLSKCQINCFTFHYEAEYANISELCKKIQQLKIDVGISVKPKTQINEEILELCSKKLVNKILVMTVEPGFGGQKFMESMMDKVKLLRQKFPELDIQVDGGLTEETVKIAALSGANCIVAGSSIFNSKDKTATIQSMKTSVDEIINK